MVGVGVLVMRTLLAVEALVGVLHRVLVVKVLMIGILVGVLVVGVLVVYVWFLVVDVLLVRVSIVNRFAGGDDVY